MTPGQELVVERHRRVGWPVVVRVAELGRVGPHQRREARPPEWGMVATEKVVRDPLDHLQRHVRQEEALDRNGVPIGHGQDMIQELSRPVCADQAKKIADRGGLDRSSRDTIPNSEKIQYGVPGIASETLAQHNRDLGGAAAGAVKANFTACPREAGVVLVLNVVQPQARSDRSNLPWSRSSTNRRYVSTMP